MTRVLCGNMANALPLAAVLLALGCAAAPTSPSVPSPTSASSWTLSVSMESPDARCELSKSSGSLTWRCGDAAPAAVTATADAAAVVKLVESTAWVKELTITEPEEAGSSKRSFRFAAGDGAIEVLRYPLGSGSLSELGLAFDNLIAVERKPPVEVKGKQANAFPDVADHGLVTIQDISLVGPPNPSSVRVAADGTWTWTRAGANTNGKLAPEQLAAVKLLLAEAATAKPSTEQDIPCDAVPSDASRVLMENDRAFGWSGPCAGPPPPAVFATLHRYLHQAAEGRPAAELEKTLRER